MSQNICILHKNKKSALFTRARAGGEEIATINIRGRLTKLPRQKDAKIWEAQTHPWQPMALRRRSHGKFRRRQWYPQVKEMIRPFQEAEMVLIAVDDVFGDGQTDAISAFVDVMRFVLPVETVKETIIICISPVFIGIRR